MFKSKAKKLAVASVLSIATLVAIPLNTLAAGVLATNMSELQAAIKTEMTERNTEFDINYTGPSTNATIGTDLSTATKAVQDSDDYLKWSWSTYNASLSGNAGNYNINFKVGYVTTADQESVVDIAVNKALEYIITPGMTDIQKEKAIHTWICNTASYDTTLANHSAYAAIVDPHKTVCQGYALLMYKMLNQAGVTAKIINGTLKGGDHAWNMVQIDGSWYQVDATSNDAGWTFYNVADSVLAKNGFVWDKTKFPEAAQNYTEVAGETELKVNLSKISTSVSAGETISLTASVVNTVTEQPIPEQTVNWKSSNTAIATVSTDGTVTGVKDGMARITATTADGTATSSCEITVTPAVTLQTKMTLSETAVSITAGSTKSLVATVTYADSNEIPPTAIITWTSSNPAIATVSSNGLVTGLKPGAVRITATTPGITASTSIVTVTTAPVETTVTPVETTVTPVETTVTPVVTTVTPVVTTVTPVVTTVTPVETTVTPVETTVTPVETTVTPVETTVTPVVTLQTILTLSKTAVSITAGSNTQLVATATYANSTETPPTPIITWTSSNPAIATVSSNGLVTGLKPGAVRITAKANGITAPTSIVTVTTAPVVTTVTPTVTLQTILTLSKTAVSITAGSNTQLVATATYTNSTKTPPTPIITWTSSNPAIATVSSNGLVTGLKPGAVRITAKANGITAPTSIVTVTTAVK